MLSAATTKLLQEQINKEFFSAYLYIEMANYYEHEGLPGFAHWFVIQAQEERDHAMLFRQYLINNNVCVHFTAIAEPNQVYENHGAPLHAALEHEHFVTASINAIYAQAQKDHDFRTIQFLDWFVKEQGEEEKNANDNITNYELFGKDPKALYMLNKDMLARVYAAPSLVL